MSVETLQTLVWWGLAWWGVSVVVVALVIADICCQHRMILNCRLDEIRKLEDAKKWNHETIQRLQSEASTHRCQLIAIEKIIGEANK